MYSVWVATLWLARGGAALKLQRAQQRGPTPCGAPPEVVSASWRLATRHGERIEYTCAQGHWVDGDEAAGSSFTADCEATEPPKWTAIAHACKAAQCAALPAAAKSGFGNFTGATTLSGRMEEPRSFGEKLVIACARGFTGDGLVNGPTQVEYFCDETGEFRPTLSAVTTCERISCGLPPVVSHAEATQSDQPRFFQQQVQYECESRALTPAGDSSFTATCEAEGKFAGLSLCEPRSCAVRDLPEFPFARVAIGSGSAAAEIDGADRQRVELNSLVSYSCDAGYELAVSGSRQTSFFLRCEMVESATGGAGVMMQFTAPPETQCRPRLCTLPMPEFPGARYSLEADTDGPRFQDVVGLTCEAGLALDGDKTQGFKLQAACDATGTWDFVLAGSKASACKPVVCGSARDVEPELTAYGLLTVQPGTFAARDNRTLAVTCAAGARTPARTSVATIVCGDQGDFVADAGGLCGVPCAAAAFKTEAAGATISVAGDSVVAGELAYATCARGFAVASEPGRVQTKQELVCSRAGVAQPLKKCEKITCGLAPKEIGLGATARLVVPGSSASVDEAVEYRCKNGYMRQSGAKGVAIKATCGEDGLFHADVDCVKIQCDTPPALPNTKITTNVYQSFDYQEAVHYVCLPGYQSVPGFTAVCGSDGSWEFSQSCQRAKLDNHLDVGASKAAKSSKQTKSSCFAFSASPLLLLAYILLN